MYLSSFRFRFGLANAICTYLRLKIEFVYEEKFEPLMYILAPVFFRKDDKYVFKARNSCCV